MIEREQAANVLLVYLDTIKLALQAGRIPPKSEISIEYDDGSTCSKILTLSLKIKDGLP